MSMAVLSWSDNLFSGQYRLRRMAAATFLIVLLLRPVRLFSQSASPAANQERAHRILESTIEALGGRAWLDLRTIQMTCRTAGFYQGAPTGTISDVTISTELPDKQRIDSSKGQVIQVFVGSKAWEITYQGKKSLPDATLQDFLRWQTHSLRVVLGEWYRNPATVLVDEGQSVSERRLVDKVMLISPSNDAVTLEIDAENHLPLRIRFTWRDPRFHDKNTDIVEYDNYQRINGIATSFTVTRKQNGETVNQLFVEKVAYNMTFSKDLFDPDNAAAHLK